MKSIFKKKSIKKSTKRRLGILVYILSLVTAFLIQTSVIPLLPFLSASPNLLLILTFSIGFIHGSLPGMIYGLSAGLLLDLFYSGPFGFYSLIFVVIGYVNGFFCNVYYEEYITLPMIMCVVNEFIYHVYIYFFRFFFREKFDIPYYLQHVVLPAVVFSLMVTLILYRFVFSATEKIDK
ncbi:rod shape-determining protein MreD [Oribacterium sp. P6A1]|uniref:rod shape-determining protein MreD n=1 Tax=Oribacterium sp. P6A1 TaxID=1410612 RepID=UPI00055C8FED|nr:rod shape-determining protein MreD [Oribacterium sp. P6A1]